MENNSKIAGKWVTLAIYSDSIESILNDAISPFLKDPKKTTAWGMEKFIFNRGWDRGYHLLLMFKTSSPAFENILKTEWIPSIQKHLDTLPATNRSVDLPVNDWFLPYSNNHIQFTPNFLFDMMETGGLQSAYVAEDILAKSSRIILSLIEQSENSWESDAAIGIAIQLHLGLLISFGMNKEEIAFFYTSMFQNLLSMTSGSSIDFQETLLKGLRDNYESQKEGIVEFIDYLVESISTHETFDEAWMNEWLASCTVSSHQLLDIQAKGNYIVPENYLFKDIPSMGQSVQAKWPVLEYYLRAINCQLGIVDALELNLLYALMNGSKSILNKED